MSLLRSTIADARSGQTTKTPQTAEKVSGLGVPITSSRQSSDHNASNQSLRNESGLTESVNDQQIEITSAAESKAHAPESELSMSRIGSSEADQYDEKLSVSSVDDKDISSSDVFDKTAVEDVCPEDVELVNTENNNQDINGDQTDINQIDSYIIKPDLHLNNSDEIDNELSDNVFHQREDEFSERDYQLSKLESTDNPGQYPVTNQSIYSDDNLVDSATESDVSLNEVEEYYHEPKVKSDVEKSASIMKDAKENNNDIDKYRSHKVDHLPDFQNPVVNDSDNNTDREIFNRTDEKKIGQKNERNNTVYVHKTGLTKGSEQKDGSIIKEPYMSLNESEKETEKIIYKSDDNVEADNSRKDNGKNNSLSELDKIISGNKNINDDAIGVLSNDLKKTSAKEKSLAVKMSEEKNKSQDYSGLSNHLAVKSNKKIENNNKITQPVAEQTMLPIINKKQRKAPQIENGSRYNTVADVSIGQVDVFIESESKPEKKQSRSSFGDSSSLSSRLYLRRL